MLIITSIALFILSGKEKQKEFSNITEIVQKTPPFNDKDFSFIKYLFLIYIFILIDCN